MVIRFEIGYDENPDGMYFPGQVVKGQASISLEEPIPTKGIRIRIRGFAEVRWDESVTVTDTDGTSKTVTDTHSDEEVYFDTTTECIEIKGLEYTLEPGLHTFTFECPLPQQGPSSFEGSYGRIRYETRITIVRPRKFNKSYSKGFNVLKIFDLNHFPELKIPAKMEVIKNFCCGPCKSRPLVLSMAIPQTGYVPGEFVNVNARLVNHSTTKVERVRIAINLIAHYSVRNRISTKTEKIAVAKSKFGGFEKSSLEVKDKIQVPPTPPTCQDLCQIIKITYEIELIATVSGAHISPVISIPITMGNIPYVARTARISQDALIANLRNGMLSELSIHSDIDLPPPSYEEAIFVQPSHPRFPVKDEENTDTHFEKYAPRYPFYSSQFPASALQENHI